MGFTDKELGMDRMISRRDFMNGAAMAIGGAAIAGRTNLFGQSASAQTAEAAKQTGL